MNLSERVRSVLRAPPPTQAVRVVADTGPGVEHALGGQWREAHGSRLFIVERCWDAGARHGAIRVGDIAAELSANASHAASLGKL